LEYNYINKPTKRCAFISPKVAFSQTRNDAKTQRFTETALATKWLTRRAPHQRQREFETGCVQITKQQNPLSLCDATSGRSHPKK
jgi:hypothetical protein